MVSDKYKKLVRPIVALACFAIIVYGILNWAYLSKQIGFWFSGKTNFSEQQGSNYNNKLQPNYLSIPSLGIEAPIVEPAQSNEQAFQDALKKGVVHYPGTAEVGQPGNSYIFGHSSDFAFKGGDYKTVFALLPRIEKGAEIQVSDQEGNMFTYTVTEQFVANSTDLHLLDQNTNGEKILTVQTSYPVGTALKRYIVKAKLKE